MADEKFFMEVNKNTKLENSQTNRWLVGTMWHYAWQPLNNLRTFFGWDLTKLGDGCKSLFSRATTTKSDKFLGLKRKSTESSRNERGNGTIQSTRHNVHKNAQTEVSIQGISLDEEEFHTEINIKDNYKSVNALKGLDFSFASSQQAYNLWDSQQTAHFGESHTEINIKEDNHKPLNALKGLDFSFASSQQAYNLWDSQQTAHFGESHTEINIKEDNHKPLNALKGLDFKGPIFEVINPILIKPILKNPNGERPKREISNKRVGFNRKVAVLLFDEEESPAETQNRVKSFKEIDSSDKGKDENKKMIRKSSYEVADEFKSFKGSDLKKSFIRIGGKVIKKSK